MVYKGIISNINITARTAEVVIPVLDNQVTPMLKLADSVSQIEVGDKCLVSILSESLADGAIICSLSNRGGETDYSIVDDYSGWVVKEGILTQWGIVIYSPTMPNTPTPEKVIFTKPFSKKPFVTVNPMSNDVGTALLGCNASDITPTGCTIYLTRDDTANMIIEWFATGHVAETGGDVIEV